MTEKIGNLSEKKFFLIYGVKTIIIFDFFLNFILFLNFT